ncbi:MAG: sulfatase-like hydrolase/transferase [Candidatus Hydrogenedentes bacterium]|nr:sulfatase-like hydrolase/transferase [Candidatus Hydrogenedentota bacterium]
MISRRQFLGQTACATILAGGMAHTEEKPAERPNILWLSTEDIGPHLGCYGEPHAVTPALDAFARESVRYTNAHTTAGVCAPNRSCIISGMYAATLGSQHMRSGGEGTERSIKPEVPSPIQCFPKYLRDAGYYCTNNSKEDYNFVRSPDVWDESSGKAHWRNRPDKNQPFFAVFNFTGTHEGSVNATGERRKRLLERLTPDQRRNPDDIPPPPFHPDTPAVRKVWAHYHEIITGLDYWFADHLKQLDEAGLADNTIVFFWSDHGQGMPRCKRWIYESGTHIPLMVRIPERWRMEGQGEPGTVDEQLVSSVDFAPTVLRLTGLPVPDYMQGRPFLGSDLPSEREYVYAARDRMDERYDIIRMVRDKRFRYIRNYEPFKPYDQYMNTAEKSVIKQELHRLAKEKALRPGGDWVTANSKPIEELYDTEADPHEVNNLAEDPAYADVLARLRRAHEAWMRETRDLGLLPEPELNALGEEYGTRAQIWEGLAKDAPGFWNTLRDTAVRAGRPSADDRGALLKAQKSPHASIRYWAVTGLGLLNSEAPRDALATSLDDSSPTVRVAAALALFRCGSADEQTLDVLRHELQSPKEWVRLHAAIALDEMGEAARPAEQELKEALDDTHNKYVVRVANRALNQLLGTNNRVR